MQNIEQIIKKIEKLEWDFEMLNSRILEFANSTKKESLDFELLNFYIESLQKFKNLASEYKKELEVQDFKKAEYRAKQEIFTFRLEKLEKIFDLNIEKLKLISKTKEKFEKNNLKKNAFSSKKEMIEVERSIYEFYKEYEKNLWFQKKYNIKISLNNDFENKIEKELESLDLIKKEKKYLEKLNEIFEEIELLIDGFYLLLESLKKYENIINFYWYKIEKNNKIIGKEKENFIEKLIIKNLKNNYENKNFDIENQEFFKDFLKIKKLLLSENNFLKAIKNIIKFQKEYSYFSDLDSVYNIFWKNDCNEFLNLFEKIKKAKTKIELKKEFSKFWWVFEITKKLNYFEKAYNFLEEFDYLYTKNSKILDYSIFNFFDNLFWNELSSSWEKFIKNWLLNIKNNLKIVLEKEKDFWKINKYLEKLNSNLKEIKSKLSKIVSIINRVSFEWTYKLRNSQREVKVILFEIAKIFYGKKEADKIEELSNYLDSIIYKKYQKAKKEYYARLNSYNSWYSSSWSWSSWSSWSSGWWSFSSSYSSSWWSSW